ncbi:Protein DETOXIFICATION 16 [Dichanthelium oligosanthes]|uniref:Protein DETOXIFICATION n=1 Tax=Dichanthelium oligosanthes TaxID=888268 RepID=A0A1E5UT14_9POAL|nr:Protein DETOXIFICATION 16 [Dichanthelium oligosanthes]
MENHGGAVAGGEVSSVLSEVKKQLRLAAPLAAGLLLQKIIQTISIMFVGRLGELPLASASLATSFASVTGFSVLTGMASSLDTLCGQAFGAEQRHLLGVYKQRAMLVLALVSVPVAVVWAYTGEILVWFRQDREIAAGAGSYVRCMISALFLFGQLQCHVRFLQPQNVVVPVMLSSAATTGLHVAVCWLLVRRLGLGANGAALANAVSNLVNLSILALYVRLSPSCKDTWTGLSPSCKDTWTGFSREAFRGIPGFLKLAVPSAAMVCMEWWSFELLVLLSGLLPNPKLETAVMSVCFNTYVFAFMLPMGLGAAASIRVSNELGAGRPQAARLATRVVMLLAFSLGVSEGLVMVLARNLLGYAYSNEEEVAMYTARLMPFLALCTLFDCLQCVLSGVVRGCGRQKIGAFINLSAFYIVGIPVASIFAFVCHLRGTGLWFGILCGVAVQMLLLLCITLCTNWNKEALKANDRVFSSTLPADMISSGCTEQESASSIVGKDAQRTIEGTKGCTAPS